MVLQAGMAISSELTLLKTVLHLVMPAFLTINDVWKDMVPHENKVNCTAKGKRSILKSAIEASQANLLIVSKPRGQWSDPGLSKFLDDLNIY